MEPLTISRVHARAVVAPMQRPIRTASGALNGAPLLLVDVETREGVTGRDHCAVIERDADRPCLWFRLYGRGAGTDGGLA